MRPPLFHPHVHQLCAAHTRTRCPGQSLLPARPAQVSLRPQFQAISSVRHLTWITPPSVHYASILLSQNLVCQRLLADSMYDEQFRRTSAKIVQWWITAT